MPRALHALVCVLLFATTCALVLRAEKRALERLPGFTLEEQGPPAIKAAHLRARGEEIELLFLGSSRVYRHLNPAVFDERLAELGLPVTSYNYGLAGARFYELLHLAEGLLEAPPPALRWIVLELGDPEPPLEDANLRTRRSLEWHTPELTWMAAMTAVTSERPWAERWNDARGHFDACLLRQANVGLGLPALISLFEPSSPPEDATPGGFFPLDFDTTPTIEKRRLEFLERLTSHPRLLRERVREIRPRGAARPVLPERVARVVERLIARLQAAGIEPLFFLSPPAERDNRDWVGAHESGLLPNLFAYDDPAQWPEFYMDLESRYDLNHLYMSAGNRLTRLLADDVARHLARAEGR